MSLRVSRRLAEAYFNVGSYTLAMQECEVILIEEPNAPDILAMLGEIETRLHASGEGDRTPVRATNLVRARREWRVVDRHAGSAARGQAEHERTRRRISSAKFLIVQQLFSEEEVKPALERGEPG